MTRETYLKIMNRWDSIKNRKNLNYFFMFNDHIEEESPDKSFFDFEITVVPVKRTCKDDETIAQISADKDGFIVNHNSLITGVKQSSNTDATLEGKFSYLFKTDSIVEQVREDLLRRSQLGIKKYNTTLDRTDLSLKDWLTHAYEECLDQANYLKRSIVELEKQNK